MIDINYIFKLWIEPELTFRRNQGSIDNNFKVQRCLIKFPPDSKCIIEFNNEIHWNARVEHAFETSKSKGTPVFQHEIKKIIDIDPPEYEGEKVAFVYIQFIGHDATRSYYTMVFDFSPNAKRQGLPADESRINLALTDCLNKLLQDRVLISCTQYEQILRQIGLWTAPALLPYPLSKIIVKLNENKKDEAIGLLVSCGTPEFIEQLVQKWWSCEPFLKRKKLIEDSLEAHRSQKYTLSIHALIPAIEGIITEFILLNLPEDEQMPFRTESKTKKFRELVIEQAPISSFAYQIIVNLSIDFILKGPVLEAFENWQANINKAFPNRHVIGHGRYEESLFIEEKSIKLFLLLDTIYWIITNPLP